MAVAYWLLAEALVFVCRFTDFSAEALPIGVKFSPLLGG